MPVDPALWAIAMLGVITRPWNSPEFVWAMAGAAMPVLFGLLSWVSRRRESGGDAPNTDLIRKSNLGNDLDAA
jgi:Zn-dependent protease with chaperone function